MTKEQKAKTYAEAEWNALTPYETTCIGKTECVGNSKDDYLAGYDAAEKDNEEMMVKFAEWIVKNNYQKTGDNEWWDGVKDPINTDKQLLETFTQQNK